MLPAPSMNGHPVSSHVAVVSARGAALVRRGYPWVFRQDVTSGPATDAGSGGPALVEVHDGRGRTLGVATWAARSRLALRLVARGDVRPPADLVGLVATRLEEAAARRRALQLDRDAYRLAHAESDELPGLIVDRYAD